MEQISKPGKYTYNVWVTLYGGSAKNAGIIGEKQAVRSSWATGKLTYVPDHSVPQQNFTFTANSDDLAWIELSNLFRARNPRNAKPLAGRSYMRHCRA